MCMIGVLTIRVASTGWNSVCQHEQHEGGRLYTPANLSQRAETLPLTDVVKGLAAIIEALDAILRDAPASKSKDADSIDELHSGEF